MASVPQSAGVKVSSNSSEHRFEERHETSSNHSARQFCEWHESEFESLCISIPRTSRERWAEVPTRIPADEDGRSDDGVRENYGGPDIF